MILSVKYYCQISVKYYCQKGTAFVRHVLKIQGHRIDAQNLEELRGMFKKKLSVK